MAYVPKNDSQHKGRKGGFYKNVFIKLCAIIMVVVMTFGLCSCELFELIPPSSESPSTNPNPSPSPDPKPDDGDDEDDGTFTVTYLAGEGGSISGEAVQYVDSGKNATEVEAVPDNGYRFVKWSDDVDTAKRTDKNINEDITVTALFASNSEERFSITYTCSNYAYCTWDDAYVGNAPIDGQITVTVTPNLGYRFVCWSDGQTSPTRSDNYTNAGKTFEAVLAVDQLDIPVMIINTDDGQGVYSKDVYKTCKITVIDEENEQFCFENEKANIRGRGNSSWEWPKKPYKLKFNSKISLFGNGKAKKWTLIANYCDFSLSRNFMVYSLAEEFEELSKSTTSTQYVDVYFNGRYDGVYLVCEQVETGSNRVDVEDDLEKVTDPEQLGFLIELDKRVLDYYRPNRAETFEYGGDYYFEVDSKFFWDETPFTVKSPDPDDAGDLGLDFYVYLNYIRNYMNDALEILWGGNYSAVTEKFDVQSWAEGYIIDELFKNVDVAFSSFYMFKDEKDGKLYRGPLWDYDISSDNCNYSNDVNNKNNIYARYRNSIYQKLMEYSEFRALVAQILNEKASKINAVLDNCVSYVLARSNTFNRNFERWKLLNWGKYEGWCPVSDYLRGLKTWEEHVNHLRSWLDGSLTYMLSQYTLNY